MKTKLLVLLATTIVVATAVAVRVNARARRAASEAAADAAETAALGVKIGDVEDRLRAAQAAHSELEKKIAALQTAATAAEHAGSAGQKPSGAKRSLNPATVIANNPEKLAAYLKDFRESLYLKYGAMFHALGLSPEQIEKFLDLKVWTEQHDMDVIAVAETKGIDSRNPSPEAMAAFKTMQREEAATIKQREADIFGPLIDQYRGYVQAESVRTLVRRLSSSEAYPETPLTAAQVERVTQILADNSRRSSGGSVVRLTVNWANAGAQLEGVVSAGQLALLQQVHRQMEAVQSSQQELNRALAPLKSSMPKG